MEKSLPCPADVELPTLLRQLADAVGRGDDTAFTATLGTQPREAWLEHEVLVAALCLGGLALAQPLVEALNPTQPAADCSARIVDAYCQVAMGAEPGPGETHTAQRLIDRYALPGQAAGLMETARAECIAAFAPLDEVMPAVKTLMAQRRWPAALRGLQRWRDESPTPAPRRVWAMGAHCLHRLGRYADAESWAQTGLGEDASSIAALTPRSEAELLAAWQGATQPVVSILCTTYNHERYLESTLRGFVGQQCDFPFEILIHDDASTDGTQALIRDWQQRYPTLIKPILQRENQKSRGVRPLELLLARAQGEFIATCEGDDYWVHPGKLTRQVEHLRAHPEVSCVTHNYVHYIESTLTARTWRPPRKDFPITARELMGMRFLLWLPTLMFRRRFDRLPPERALAAFGDQFLTSYLGTWGRGTYMESFVGAVRRENPYSTWTPLHADEKEARRIQTWAALIRLHQRLGNGQAVQDLNSKIERSALDAARKAAIVASIADAPLPQSPSLAVA